MFIHPDKVALIILNIVCLATFLMIFFFTYAANIEKQIIESQMKYITNSLLDDITPVLGQKDRNTIELLVKNMKLPNLQEQDDEVKADNKKVMKKAFMVILPLLIGGAFLSYYLSNKYNFSFKETIIQCVFTIGAIAIVEFVFLRFYGSTFYSADLNVVKYTILKTMYDSKNN